MKRGPAIEERAEQAYVGTRAVMPMSDFERAMPEMTAKAFELVEAQGLRATGQPFLRYHVIDMPERMDVELGVPVAAAADVLPAGRYAVLTYTGVKNGVAANRQLIAWIEAQGEQVVSHDSENGQVFKARCETYLSDAKAEPDQDKWDIEVAIKLRE